MVPYILASTGLNNLRGKLLKEAKMRRISWIPRTELIFVALVGLVPLLHQGPAEASGQCHANCQKFHISDTASTALAQVILPPEQGCQTQLSHNFPVPDPKCTPGAINPTLTTQVLRDPDFRTCCVRDNATSAAQKTTTYGWYGIPHPSDNTGQNQTCELDHLVSLELGGADTLDNIWPQCGPSGVSLPDRYFKEKDMVENYLAQQVKSGQIDLSVAQKGIASDWTQYLEDAKAYYHQSSTSQ